MINKEAMQSALDAGDMRRLRRLVNEAITTLGDRPTADVYHAVSKMMAQHGETPPKRAVLIKHELIEATLCVDEFMRDYQMKESSNNRQIIVDLVTEEVIRAIRSWEGIVPDTPSAINYAKLPMYKKVFIHLSSPYYIASNLNRAFPGYLQAGKLHFAGISYETKTPQHAPGTKASYHNQFVVEHEDDPETEADRRGLKEAQAEVKLRERKDKRLMSNEHNPLPTNPPCRGLNPDGSIDEDFDG